MIFLKLACLGLLLCGLGVLLIGAALYRATSRLKKPSRNEPIYLPKSR